MTGKMITVEDVARNKAVRHYIKGSDNYLNTLNFTKHGEIHAQIVSRHAKNILLKLGFPERDAELAAIAGYIHDIGNFINRDRHEHTAAVLAMDILRNMGMDLKEKIIVAQAVGNHDEKTSVICSNITAAIIIADKCDVHRSRVRSTKWIHEDIHIRVNYAVRQASLKVFRKRKTIQLSLEVDTEISPVIEYFEIFLSRMIICKKAADYLGCKFELVINGSKLV